MSNPAIPNRWSKPTVPNSKDPFEIYKAGEQPRKCHSVDFPGWEANGWSKEPTSETPAEAELPAENPSETGDQSETEAPAETKKRSTRKPDAETP